MTWIGALVWFATQLRDWVLTLRDPGLRLIEAGGGLQRTFGSAARTAGQVPLVGAHLSDALGQGADAGRVVAQAGQLQVDTVAYGALGFAVAAIVFGLVPVLWWWLPRRVHYARAAGTAAVLRARDPELLALRALTEIPARRLLKINPAPAAAWRRGEPEVVDRLAAMQLAALGLRPARETESPVAIPEQ